MKHISFFPIQHFGLRCAALLSACCLLLLAGCKDDDGGEGATMTINKIYLENAKATDSITDREVTFARLGQLIRIEGSGATRSPMTSPFAHQHLSSAASTTHCRSPVRKSLSMVPIYKRPPRSHCPVA